MKYRPLGDSDINVSEICLGTMTWGEQNTEAEAFAQMDFALEQGVTFWDTAELYAVPPKPDTYGATERIIGHYFKQHGRRDQVVLASKIAGPGEFVQHIRNGQTRFTRETITEALEASLTRLNTDYLDLYQLHWPERHTNYFGQLGFTPPSEAEQNLTPLVETLRTLADLIKAGKIRSYGLSNETAWGTMKVIGLCDQLGLPKPVSVQNPYNLLNRSYEVGLAEIAYRENVGCLAYSPLAFGVLTGKYRQGQRPEHARVTLFPRFDRYFNPQADAATEAYVSLAAELDITPAQLALAYVNSRPFVTSNIIGATNLEQLAENIASHQVTLSDDALKQIEAIHQRYPNPSP
ncbi:NADP(H)-dependent aldo-keto reductase [Thiomicrospira sp. ALE5]|uniref:NADP(H)-dependent aldo-keto reductase n=1 Tax=Thiomicrospira sp. ALE5 TaxID=748650 RepID=UPI0008EC4630|nr:NADP(H)-dependent aldo-keto reductase [Thiomicrospira sp. ALE5]SFR53544.1 Predicted oxidoreductase [Thiomicrospira sp. ALE5]